MLFSSAFNIERTEDDDWFDPILIADTKLFVDPFMIFLDADPFWQAAHETLIAHFDRAFKLLAESGGNKSHLKYQAAVAMLRFPEPSAFCLGYTSRGTRGSGGGLGYARSIARAMCDAIDRGVTDLDHFEALGILHEGIGPDRVSDITCTILKPMFIEYTRQVAARHNIPVDEHIVQAAGFDERRTARAMSRQVSLPTNPSGGRPVILVPQRFLRRLPVMNADDWFDSTEAADIRRELNQEVLENVSKADIVDLARRNDGSVRAWIEKMEQDSPEPYDIEGDPDGVYQWAPATMSFVRQNALELPDEVSTLDGLFDVIELILDRFQHFIEERRGWSLLWDGDGDDKPEEAVQLLFFGLASEYCRVHDINLDREVELGRGPVDFKFSTGFHHKASIEVKKLHNGKFWNGLEAQLPSYMRSDECADGWFVAVQYKGTGISKTRRAQLPKHVEELTRARPELRIRYRLVDARRKKSASKLTGDEV